MKIITALLAGWFNGYNFCLFRLKRINKRTTEANRRRILDKGIVALGEEARQRLLTEHRKRNLDGDRRRKEPKISRL